MDPHMNPDEWKAIQALVPEIKNKFKVKKMILFGSKARGDFDKYSDVDLLVLTEAVKTTEDRWQLSDIVAEINVDFGVALNCLYFNERDWEKGVNINPLLKVNVENEGVEIAI